MIHLLPLRKLVLWMLVHLKPATVPSQKKVRVDFPSTVMMARSTMMKLALIAAAFVVAVLGANYAPLGLIA
jgi:hypothetical protein